MRAACLFSRAAAAEKHGSAAGEPRLLRLGRAAVSARDAGVDRAGVCVRSADREAPGQAGGEGVPRGVRGSELRGARIFQIRGLFPRKFQCADGPFRAAAARGAPGRDQLLHVPDRELSRRCLPRRCRRAAELCRPRGLCRDVPAADRRADRPLFRRGRAAPRPDAQRRRCGLRRAAVRARAGEEDPAGQSARRARVGVPRDEGRLGALYVAVCGRIPAANLL